MKPRLLLRIRDGLKRLDGVDRIAATGARQLQSRPRPADTAWHDMLRRLDREEAERRLAEMEKALNRGVER